MNNFMFIAIGRKGKFISYTGVKLKDHRKLESDAQLFCYKLAVLGCMQSGSHSIKPEESQTRTK